MRETLSLSPSLFLIRFLFGNRRIRSWLGFCRTKERRLCGVPVSSREAPKLYPQRRSQIVSLRQQIIWDAAHVVSFRLGPSVDVGFERYRAQAPA